MMVLLCMVKVTNFYRTVAYQHAQFTVTNQKKSLQKRTTIDHGFWVKIWFPIHARDASTLPHLREIPPLLMQHFLTVELRNVSDISSGFLSSLISSRGII
jgi:hypothetical protein